MVSSSVNMGSSPPTQSSMASMGGSVGLPSRLLNTNSASEANRRYSLPLHFLPPSLWSANTSSASLVETEEAARGEHIVDEATAAQRISALRQLNGAPKGLTRHRYAKSTGARNSTFSQPVIVRTYSESARPRSQRPESTSTKQFNGVPKSGGPLAELKLPPVEAFSFKGIMDEIRHGVTEDLEKIAEICARSRYSLSNQYEVHMPPHGRGEQFLQSAGFSAGMHTTTGPTLQAIGTDEEQTRSTGKGSRTGRRARSAAYGTLETIMSSSRSSDEDKSKKKPAAALAEEVRGRATKKGHDLSSGIEDHAVDTTPIVHQQPRHIRSKSATFASMIIDNAQVSRHEEGSILKPVSLVSEPALPQTSMMNLIDTTPNLDLTIGSPTLQALMSSKPNMIRNESSAPVLKRETRKQSGVFDSLTSWIPWVRLNSSQSIPQTRIRSVSHAEGSLRGLLQATNHDKKGKGKGYGLTEAG